MQCLQCGSENPGTSYRCAACNAVLQEDAETSPGTAPQPFLTPLRESWRYASPIGKATISLHLGATAAFTMRAGLDADHGRPLFVVGSLIAVAGILLGIDAMKWAGRRVESFRGRAVAGGGVLLGAGVLMGPIGFALGQIALMPGRIAKEPMALNNARHLAVALQAYIEDNDDRLPGWITAPDGRAYHNAWDQQLSSYVKDDLFFRSGADGKGIRSPFATPPRRRTLTYALNGLLITRPKPVFDGNADWASGPYLMAPSAVATPSATIVFAEVATTKPMGGPYARVDIPPHIEPVSDSSTYRRALRQWIDIDPQAWVETSGPTDSYNRKAWDEDRGVGRALHSGGAACSFLDGHVEYVKLRKTVNGGQLGLPATSYWKPDNRNNMWNPVRQ